ncbi:ATP synthase subunit H domain-containing protein [Rhizoctonia solani AG-1 IA]|uniref:ATP synthase subunit H domain-containing protein n=1 Tax=Thanatephorus cucumeris (strain AG1-IA) TaxID=983506 RepID=L8WKY7_THACA|nr:ATP synthase subunit H domain-containing protein [Rhizoctonia solani AG-1 IA]
MSGWSVIFVGLVCIALGVIGWFVTPKGETQTILLTLTCCYLMWAITYMAQMNPLIGVLTPWCVFVSMDRMGWGVRCVYRTVAEFCLMSVGCNYQPTRSSKQGVGSQDEIETAASVAYFITQKKGEGGELQSRLCGPHVPLIAGLGV